jgi:hypothetical protein
MPELNPGLKANQVVSPDNLHTEPIPKVVNNDPEFVEVEPKVEVKPVKKSKK